MTSSLTVSNHKSVSQTITEICQIENFQGQFDLDLISEGHPKHGMYYIHNDIISISSQPQVCIFSGYYVKSKSFKVNLTLTSFLKVIQDMAYNTQ